MSKFSVDDHLNARHPIMVGSYRHIADELHVSEDFVKRELMLMSYRGYVDPWVRHFICAAVSPREG